MNIVAKDICVDSGTIMVADLDYFKQFNQRENWRDLGETFKVKRDLYDVVWNIKNTYHGNIHGCRLLNVTSGTLVVIDPGYILGAKKNGREDHKEWMRYLEKTDHFRNLADERTFVINEMGGDGLYHVHLKLIKYAK